MWRKARLPIKVELTAEVLAIILENVFTCGKADPKRRFSLRRNIDGPIFFTVFAEKRCGASKPWCSKPDQALSTSCCATPNYEETVEPAQSVTTYFRPWFQSYHPSIKKGNCNLTIVVLETWKIVECHSGTKYSICIYRSVYNQRAPFP